MLRLRQIVLVASDIDAAEAELGSFLGCGVVFRDPGVATFGLRNALFRVGDQFVEIVSPTTSGTTAGRFLEKRGGDGGYMVILQTDDLGAVEAGFADAGARVVFEATADGGNDTAIRGLHLHPKDLGGAILSIDEATPAASWLWAGEAWQSEAPATVAAVVSGVVIQCVDPMATAARWATALGATTSESNGGSVIALDDAELRFVPVDDERGEGIVCFLLGGAAGSSQTELIGTRFELRS